MHDQSIFTIMFENPFWIGLYEQFNQQTYRVSKIVFGPSEPTNTDIIDLFVNHFDQFTFSSQIAGSTKPKKKLGFKRMQREAKKQMTHKPCGTKAQIALKIHFEETKQQKKSKKSLHKKNLKATAFALKQIKKKQNHHH